MLTGLGRTLSWDVANRIASLVKDGLTTTFTYDSRGNVLSKTEPVVGTTHYTYSTLGWILPGGIWSIVSRSAFYLRLGMSGFQVAAASVVETLMVGIGGMALYGLISIFRPEVAV